MHSVSSKHAHADARKGEGGSHNPILSANHLNGKGGKAAAAAEDELQHEDGVRAGDDLGGYAVKNFCGVMESELDEAIYDLLLVAAEDSPHIGRCCGRGCCRPTFTDFPFWSFLGSRGYPEFIVALLLDRVRENGEEPSGKASSSSKVAGKQTGRRLRRGA